MIASRLFSIARDIIARGGVPGCDVGKAAGIESWAEQNLYVFAGDPTAEPAIDLEEIARRGVASECCYIGDPVSRNVEKRGARREPVVVFECRHPSHDVTTAATCRTCRDWTREPRTSVSPLTELIPPPSRPMGCPPVRRWAVGVTTAPRSPCTLELCLDSLVRAGWEEPRLFVDSPVRVEARHAHLPVSLRETRLGAWPNYYLALVELLMREPEADAYFLVQDDTIFYDRENLRAYIESALWPEGDIAAVSLYCPKPYTRSEAGWYPIGEPWLWGALAFIFPRDSAKRFVADQSVLEQRWSRRHGGKANIDTTIGDWAARQGLDIVYPTPSLAQHIGDASTLWVHGRALGARRASDFAADRG